MTTAEAATADAAHATEAPARLSAWVGVIALAQLAVLLATSTRYGYHRDEMYFIIAGQHPALGYPDQPLLVPLISAAMNHLVPGSLLVLRAPSALVSAATTLVAALTTRECAGRGRAQLIAAACTAASGFALGVGHFVTTSTFDLLSTTLVCWLVIRAVRRQSGPELLIAGVVTGLGFEAKPQVAFVAVVIVVALALVGPRWPFRSPWFFGGMAAAAVLAAPYVVWQAAHRWPQFTVVSNVAGSAEGGRAGFIPFQLVMVSPLLVPVWIAGLIWAWRSTDHTLRFMPVTYGLLVAAYLIENGKAYYLASLYPALLGIGAVPTAAWTLRHHARLRNGLLGAALAISAAVSAVLALPLLPVTQLQGSAVMAVNPDQGETVGWPRFVRTVSTAWQSIPATERARTVIFTDNYGEAGAIDLLGGRLELPRAYSGHNALSEWGRPPQRATQVLLIGYARPAYAGPYFVGCRPVGKIDNGVGLDNDEQGLPLLLCRPAKGWAELWPKLRHYG